MAGGPGNGVLTAVEDFIAPVLAGIAEKLPRGQALILGYGSIAALTAVCSRYRISTAKARGCIRLALRCSNRLPLRSGSKCASNGTYSIR